MRHFIPVLVILLLSSPLLAQSKDGNRLAYLDEVNPYYPSRTFPKLITPQWVGDKDVEAVVILGIDDMRDPKRYEAFLRPILRRLQRIDGRAPVSIMANQVDPADPQLQKWLKEGLSIECHTLDHPCPFFAKGFAKAKETYDKCVDLMAKISNSKPVAFRMPCCDSLNTPSPRFYAEIFNKTTAKGNFLTIDSSVFNVFTANDPALPRELVLLPDGTERFRRYLPKDRSFVNTIEDYPYPYVIGRLCWQFPCVTPSDWQAQHSQKPNNPETVRDWKAALDCTVIKQGVMCLVFHPHGWCKSDQIIELIDYAVAKHGKKVKFLTFKEAQERLNKSTRAQGLRDSDGDDDGVRLLDIDNDGYVDIVNGNDEHFNLTMLWSRTTASWRELTRGPFYPYKGRFGILRHDSKASYLLGMMFEDFACDFDGKNWVNRSGLVMAAQRVAKHWLPLTSHCQLLDVDGDGQCEILTESSEVISWLPENKTWQRLPFTLPTGARLFFFRPRERVQRDAGLRFLDLDGDGKLDIIFSNEKEYGIFLFKDMKSGWSRKVMAGKHGEPGASATGGQDPLPMISRNGTNNGFWVHSGQLWWSNEDTAHLKDHVDRRSINELLKKAPK